MIKSTRKSFAPFPIGGVKQPDCNRVVKECEVHRPVTEAVGGEEDFDRRKATVAIVSDVVD